MRLFLIAAACLALAFQAVAQTTREEVYADLDKAGGVYYAYPATKADNTPPPTGYEPVYISHFGRHGSRYLIDDADYQRVADVLHRADSAGALTPLGRQLMADLDTLMLETIGRGGALTPLGVRQHKGIARRMAENYPGVFAGDNKIDARSTLVVRCVLSMDAFCESLKEFNPRLQVTREATERQLASIRPGSAEADAFRRDTVMRRMHDDFSRRMTHPERLVKAVFSDHDYVAANVDQPGFLWGVYWLAADAQNVETPIDFKKYLLPEEMFDIWQITNAGFYGGHADFPGNNGVVIRESIPLLRDVVERADAALAGGDTAADLRFAHDGNLVPFAALLGIEGASGREVNIDDFYKSWASFQVSPMAGNIQLIFFRNPSRPDGVLVKVLHNEKEVRIPVPTDIFPFYRWADFKRYYSSKYGIQL